MMLSRMFSKGLTGKTKEMRVKMMHMMVIVHMN